MNREELEISMAIKLYQKEQNDDDETYTEYHRDIARELLDLVMAEMPFEEIRRLVGEARSLHENTRYEALKKIIALLPAPAPEPVSKRDEIYGLLLSACQDIKSVKRSEVTTDAMIELIFCNLTNRILAAPEATDERL